MALPPDAFLAAMIGQDGARRNSAAHARRWALNSPHFENAAAIARMGL
jgi:hypothetical protein